MIFARALMTSIAVLFGLGTSPLVSAALAAEDRCIAVSEYNAPGRAIPASLRPVQLKAGEVRLNYIGHSTFLIESPRGVTIATDYNDYVRPSVVPDIATMNHAHSTHFTNFPDPRIHHLLRGWNPEGGVAEHDVTEGDVRVRNVPTNIRDWQGGTGLCIAHLGHLHHTLTPKQLSRVGQMDIVLVPVDGSYTLDLPGMIEVVKALKAPLLIPMHYFSSYTLDRFLSAVEGEFEVLRQIDPSVVVSRATLPQKPQVLVLPGH
jgi:L-ascorbate metabolism protein UlaG (beta-lactamase superfamily)